jgi:hypothetical protein
MLVNALEAVYIGAALTFALEESKTMPKGDRAFVENLLHRIETEGQRDLDDILDKSEFINTINANGKRS